MTRDLSSQSDLAARKAAEDALLREAEARVRLRQRRGKKVRPPAPNIGFAARKAVRTAMKDYKGSPVSVMQDRWEAMVGEKLASLCEPLKLTGKAGKRTLTLRVVPAAALLIQHQSETIRQRVSAAAGGDIAKISIVQGSLRGTTLPKKKITAKLTASEEQALKNALTQIESNNLRDALYGLGSIILSQSSEEKT